MRKKPRNPVSRELREKGPHPRRIENKKRQAREKFERELAREIEQTYEEKKPLSVDDMRKRGIL